MDTGINAKELNIRDISIKSGQRPAVCVPLMGHDDEQIIMHLDSIIKESSETKIDIVEFRGDYYTNLQDFQQLENILTIVRNALGDKVLLFTIRSPKEGGEAREYAKTIEEINSFVIENKLADIVDIELYCDGHIGKLIQLANKNQVKIIMSNHDFKKTPSKDEIVSRLLEMQSLGAHIAKIAVMPESKQDLDTLLSATLEANKRGNGSPIVSMSMGAIGEQSRILGEIYGSSITFGCVGQPSAPGQLQVRVLNEMLDKVHSEAI